MIPEKEVHVALRGRKGQMKKAFETALVFSLILALCSMAPPARNSSPIPQSKDDGLALTPPMGWYPWNIFGQEPQNEKLVREIVDALVSSGMKDAGYTYVGPDEGICFSRGGDGLLTTNLERYPSGLRALGDDIHRRGLKYALYTDAGTHTCSDAMPGTKDHEFEDMSRFAEWRADYLKIDWCNTEGQDIVRSYSRLREAQRAAGRPIVHSLCSWGEGEPWKWAAPIGHLWRTTADICAPGKADWQRAMRIAAANEKLYPWAGPGGWNDPDMLIAGMPGLSETQNRAFFSLWCIMAAPLMAGNDLRDMSVSTVRILTNLEAIAIDQDPLGVQGHIVRTAGNVEIWGAKPLFDGSRAVLLFNRGQAKETASLTLSDFGVDHGTPAYVRDLWTHETRVLARDTSGTFSVPVEAGDVRFLRISGSREFPLPPVIVADTYLVSLRAEGVSPQEVSGTLVLSNKGTSDLALWKVHPGLPPWLTVTVSKDGRSQRVTSTASTAGLTKGLHHAVVRLDNVEPVSGKPMSAIYYDVDLEVRADGVGTAR
jgi:alpha-galactosidase